MSTIGVLARPDLKEAGPTVAALVAWLSGKGARVCLDDATAALGGGSLGSECLLASGREMAGVADALVVLGGDGTLLAASRLLDKPIPVLGVNFGSLGFLTEITLAELYPALEGVIEGRYEYEERRLLRAVVHRQGRPDVTSDVLNDVVITKAGPSRIIEVDVSVDGLFVSSFRADGIIVSSPTGSTAYNLAAGGPILHPTLPAIALTPICPHMLTNRPLVIDDSARVRVKLRDAREVEVHISFDGQHGIRLSEEDEVVVSRSPRSLRLVRAPARDYFEVLRAKLKWGESSARQRSR